MSHLLSLINSEKIVKDFINSGIFLFKKLKYGITDRTPKRTCNDLTDLKYELLLWSLKTDTGTAEEIEYIVEWTFSDTPISLSNVDFLFRVNQRANSPSLTIDFTKESSGNFIAFREHISQPIRGEWVNTIDGSHSIFNNGVIPDQVFKSPEEFGEYRYYISRTPIILSSQSSALSFN